MNTELLFQLYSIHSESGNEKKMRRFIRKYIRENCGNVVMVTDSYGNMLCTKGESKTYPCLASHMDQVQHNHSKDFEVMCNGDRCFGFSWKTMEMQGLGADDKNGIYICLECLKRFDVLKVAFFVGEEVGCIGSKAVNLDFFKDCRFIIEPDRRGSSDLITSMFCGDVCSEDFIKAIGAEAYGYKPERGSITDVGELTEREVGISCLNLSCGYYEAHSDEEYTVLSELQNCLEFVMHIICECREVYPFEGGGYDGCGCYSGYSGYGYGRYYGGYYSSLAARRAKKATTTVIPITPVDSEDDDDEVDEYGEDEYYGDGTYDADFEIMHMYLEWDRNKSFDEIFSIYGFDFYATSIFGSEEARTLLEKVYNDVKDSFPTYSHEEFWDDERSDAPLVETKVS